MNQLGFSINQEKWTHTYLLHQLKKMRECPALSTNQVSKLGDPRVGTPPGWEEICDLRERCRGWLRQQFRGRGLISWSSCHERGYHPMIIRYIILIDNDYWIINHDYKAMAMDCWWFWSIMIIGWIIMDDPFVVLFDQDILRSFIILIISRVADMCCR